jgi:dTDP-4-dehydrorhamnose reductase
VKALITGGGGQLARQLIATAPAGAELKAVSHAECDIADPFAVSRAFEAFRPDVVINTAAYTGVDAAEDAPETAFEVNARGAENVAAAAARADVRLIHISTDYVFDGTRSTPYPPDAATNPLSVYGASKLEGERLSLRAAPAGLVVRVGWLYSKTGSNFLSRIVAGTRTSRPLTVVRDQIGCPTSAREFAVAVWRAVEAQIRGVYHWANVGEATWYDFAKVCARLARELELPKRPETDIIAVDSDSFPSRAKRPRYSVLDPNRLAEALGIAPSGWQEALRAELLRDS